MIKLAWIGIWQIILILVLISIFALFIYAIISIVKSKSDTEDKLIWLLVVLLIPILGSIIYLLFGKK